MPGAFIGTCTQPRAREAVTRTGDPRTAVAFGENSIANARISAKTRRRLNLIIG
jgi:hypothetical protein